MSFGQYNTKLYYKNESMVASCCGGFCTFICYMIIFLYAAFVLLLSSSSLFRNYQLNNQWTPPTNELKTS